MNSNRRRESFEKFNYLLRPSKQVERKLLLEAFHRLSAGGFRLQDYTYVGLGSVYYADFLLFHKYLYIDSMICVEAADIPKRMEFNQPFEFIQLEMKRVAEVIPTLDRSRKYIVWLDYDVGLNADILKDIAGCLNVLAAESILLVTVDAEPRLPDEEDSDDLTDEDRLTKLTAIYTRELGRYYRGTVKRALLARNALPEFLAKIVRSQFKEATERRGLEFLNLFNFRYADGAQMLSLGGVIGDRRVKRRLGRSGVYKLPFVKDRAEPMQISVPPLTVREIQWLTRNLHQDLGVGALAFELDEEMLEGFKRYYKQYPLYYETLT